MAASMAEVKVVVKVVQSERLLVEKTVVWMVDDWGNKLDFELVDA